MSQTAVVGGEASGVEKESKETQLGFQIGHNVGEVARHIYDTSGQGILIDVEVEGFDAAFQRSLGLLSAAVSRHPVFEAGLQSRRRTGICGYFVAVESGRVANGRD